MALNYQEQLSFLKELQQIDLNLHKFQLAIEGFPERLRDLMDSYMRAKEALGATKAELASTEKIKKTDELELEASVEHLRDREAKLYAVKTNKEYQAAIKEISEGKRINREREDRILQAMEKIEQLKQNSTQLGTEFADKEAAFQKKKEELAAEEAELKKHVEDDVRRRPEVAAKIDKLIMRRYDFVKRRYPDAVVVIRENACQGCHRKIPPQMLNEMLHYSEFKTCPSCQRLVFLEVATSEESSDVGQAG